MDNYIFKRTLILLVAITFTFIAASFLLSRPAIKNQILEAIPSPNATKFDFNTELSKSHYKVSQFIVSSQIVDAAKADMLSGLFGLKKTRQDDSYYYYENAMEQLAVSLNGDVLIYHQTAVENKNGMNNISASTAKELAVQFVKDKSLSFDYATAEVSYEKDTYKIQFVNTLNNIKNYAYPKSVTVDRHGNILQLIYYDFAYQLSESVSTISAYEAAQRLKQKNFDISATVDIKSCELVYYETNGRISPSYKFTGEINGGAFVTFFVPAEN